MTTITLELKNGEDLHFIERIAKSIGAKIIVNKSELIQDEKQVFLENSKQRMSHIISKRL
ncbi:MAG: hypothetical protein ACOYOT_08520 [Bacteroidales bacterium]